MESNYIRTVTCIGVFDTMSKYNELEKQDIINRYFQSEQSVKDFCQTNSVASSTLYKWLKECKGKTLISNPINSTEVLKGKHDFHRTSTASFINSDNYQNTIKVLNSIRITLPPDHLTNINRVLVDTNYLNSMSHIQKDMNSNFQGIINPLQEAMSNSRLITINPLQEVMKTFSLNYQNDIRPMLEALRTVSVNFQEDMRPIQEALRTFSVNFEDSMRPIQEALRIFKTDYLAGFNIIYKATKPFDSLKYDFQRTFLEFKYISEKLPNNQLVKGTANLYQLAKEKSTSSEIKEFDTANEEPLILSLVKILLTEDLTESKVLKKVEEVFSELSQTSVESSIVNSVEMLKAAVKQNGNIKGIYVETNTEKFIRKVYTEEKTETGLIIYKSLKFKDILDNYSKLVTSQSIFRVFWKSIVSKKFKENPEEIGKLNLKTYLFSVLEQEADILEEVPRGRGEIDIYVIRPCFFPIYYAIEIKIIEKSSYPVKVVMDGDEHKKGAIRQLSDYMKNSPVSEGYLVIFDGYDEDQKPEIPDTINTDYGFIHVVRVDILPGKSQSYN